MRITVITVSYNSELTIADTLLSVSGQVFQNYEHLIIDGKSKDRTIQVVNAHEHSNIVISSEPDCGIYNGMNKGLRRAKGDVIGFLNSDDYYSDPYVLEKVAFAFQDESVEACFGDLVYVTPDKSRFARYWKSRPFIKGDFANGWCPAHPTFFIRRSALDRLGGFDESFKMAADVEFMMRYLERGGVKAVYIPYVLVRMRLGGASNQSWGNVWKQNLEVFAALRKNKVPFSVVGFWVHKIISRAQQYVAARRFKADALQQPTAQPPA